MSSDELEHKRKLLETNKRVLQKLELEKALYGPSTKSEVLIQIEDRKQEIEQLEKEIEGMSGNNVSKIEDEQTQNYVALPDRRIEVFISLYEEMTQYSKTVKMIQNKLWWAKVADSDLTKDEYKECRLAFQVARSRLKDIDFYIKS